jgi:uncharacterized protein YjbJ (UPF0337 family)
MFLFKLVHYLSGWALQRHLVLCDICRILKDAGRVRTCSLSSNQSIVAIAQAKGAQDKAGDYTQAAKDKASDLAGSAKETAGQAQDKAGSTAQAAKDKASGAADQAGSKVCSLKNDTVIVLLHFSCRPSRSYTCE